MSINVSRQRQFLLGVGLTLGELYCAVVLSLPGDTTAASRSYDVLNKVFHGDTGLAWAFLAVGVAQGAACVVRHLWTVWAIYAVCFGWWAALAVGFFLGFPYALGPGLCIGFAAVNGYMLRFASLDRRGAIPAGPVG